MRYLAVVLLLLLPSCKEEAVEIPDPTPMTDTALSHFCQMNVAEHGGPKGQVHLDGYPAPIFFAQVRDLVAYLKSPERDADILAIYVSDMGVAASWAEPGAENWIAAETAQFVVGAGVAGGMGAPEIVPFAQPAAAQDFVERYGGAAMSLDAIPDDAAIGAVDLDQELEHPA
ncbi:nitrous oxide reductase accessory protein NosL [Tropicimonas marinistellae]|uniref:nitrous oxide reductase accessory protein NosL n=1 Tax=Tropicimonas marinistellae TaxID=1739787 RepID=UPI00082D0BFB|nr:nitrous oxide reductase accessory protein NosL [Tropicimonas marinistellae]